MLITPNAGVGYNIIGGTDLVVRNTLANRRKCGFNCKLIIF
jgi:hypothetical protein